MADQGRMDWHQRSKLWTAAAEAGAPEDDAINQTIIDAAAIKPGAAVLDLASGTGDPAISIALAMAGKGRVTCCDLVPRMVDAARGRARNLDLTIMAFVAADMVALPFADGTFDCVTCRFGIMSPRDKVTAAAETRRVLKPGGRAVYVVSGAYQDNPGFWVPRRTIAAFFGADEDLKPRRHSMARPGTLAEVLDAAGFTRVEERGLSHTRRVDDPRAYVSDHLKRSAEDRVHGLTEARRLALTDAIVKAWEPFTQDGVLRIPNTARLAIARKGDA